MADFTVSLDIYIEAESEEDAYGLAMQVFDDGVDAVEHHPDVDGKVVGYRPPTVEEDDA